MLENYSNKSKIVNILISDVRHDPLDEARLQFRGERSQASTRIHRCRASGSDISSSVPRLRGSFALPGTMFVIFTWSNSKFGSDLSFKPMIEYEFHSGIITQA